MSKLEELEEELYGRDESRILRRSQGGKLLGRIKTVLPPSWREKESKKSPGEARAVDRFAANFFWAALIFIFIVGGSIFVFFYLSTRGEEASLTIHGQGRITAGELMTVPISYKNESRTVLKEVELSVVLPVGSLIREENIDKKSPARITRQIHDLSPGEEGVVEIKVRIFGREGEEKIVSSALLYRPENLRARFSVRAEERFLISRVPLVVSWTLPGVLSRGQEAIFSVHYASNAEVPFENMYLRLDYPPGFTFKKGSPPPKIGENIWSLGTFNPGTSGEISLGGVISGGEGEIKAFKAGLGILDESTKEWNAYSESVGETKIAVTPLFVGATLKRPTENIIHPGDSLLFAVRYKNNTNFVLRNVSLRAFLEMLPFPDSSSGFLEKSSLSVDKGGVFNSSEGAVIWAPANVEELREVAPGEEGDFSFSLHTKDRPPLRGERDKNLSVRLRVKIDSVGIPPELAGLDLASEEITEYKVGSLVLFGGRSLYRSSPIVNSGAFPPRVGEKTTYTVQWEVRNFTNDLRDVEIKTTLPPNIFWESVTFPQGEKITFESSSGEIKWRIGEVKAATGVLAPALVGAFQVSLVPSEADAGRAPTLLNDSVLGATDLFTGEKITKEVRALTTELREDPTTTVNEWRVMK